MYTSFIGNYFLEKYNNDIKKDLTAKEYFENVLFPLFYDDSKYLQSPIGTPMFQLIATHKKENSQERKDALAKVIEKIQRYSDSKEKFPEMSFAVGFSSADLLGTTSGQVSSLELPLKEDDMYASWIGAAFGIGMAGGLNILIDDYEILKILQEGWKIYREYVNENTGIENKVETWNGIWLSHRISKNFIKNSPNANFHPISAGKEGVSKMERPSWTNIIFTLAKIFPNRSLNAYVYSFGQMNKTIGFVRIALPEVSKLSEIYNALFGKNNILSNKELAKIYQSEYGFSVICERFSLIGLRSLIPKDLKKYMPSRFEEKLPVIKNDEESLINYFLYITWIIAMLNNKELLELAEKSAYKLKEFISLDKKKVNMKRTNAVQNLLNSKNRKDLIESLTEITQEDNSMSDIGNELVNRIMLDIAPDNITLFVTLLRFKYLSNNL